MPKLDAAELEAFLAEAFPLSPVIARVERVDDTGVRLRRAVTENDLRPGGTISGPVLMGLADTAMYLAVVAQIGPVALAVTTNLSIDFLRKPELADVIADVELLKLGQRLAVGHVALRSRDIDGPLVAHATVTYSIPPR